MFFTAEILFFVGFGRGEFPASEARRGVLAMSPPTYHHPLTTLYALPTTLYLLLTSLPTACQLRMSGPSFFLLYFLWGYLPILAMLVTFWWAEKLPKKFISKA